MTCTETTYAPGRIRTCGPLLRRQPLCPLSYGGPARRLASPPATNGYPLTSGPARSIVIRISTRRSRSIRARYSSQGGFSSGKRL
jgi:hypothetical protein